MPDCDLHPMCQSQGCIADPMHCKRAQDIRDARVRNASLAAMNRLRIVRAISLEDPE